MKAGKNVIAVRLFNRFGPGGFAGKPGLPVGPNGDRSGTSGNGPANWPGNVPESQAGGSPVAQLLLPRLSHRFPHGR